MLYVFRHGNLPKLDLQIDRGSDFKAWKIQWDAYFNLSGLSTQSDEKQVYALTLCFTHETLTVVENLGLTDAQRKSTKEMITAIEAYINGQINESMERRAFRSRVQQEGETFDDFLVSLRELAKTCAFCNDDCIQKNIRDQIIAGLADGEAVETLLKEKNLTLETTVSKCRAHEAAKRQRAELAGGTPGTSVHAIRQKQQNPSSNRGGPKCLGCGSGFHPGGQKQCPAYQLVCHLCNRTGHIAKVCRSRKPSQTQSHDPATNAVITTPTVNTVQAGIQPAPMLQAEISTSNGSTTTQVLPDSGADISIAGPSVIQSLNDHPGNLLPSQITPRTVNGQMMTPIGKLPVQIKIDNHIHKDELHIYPNIKGILISWKSCMALSILPPSYPEPISIQRITSPKENQTTSESLINEFPSVFNNEVKPMEGEQFHIALIDEAKPFCVKTPRTIPYAYREKLKAELQSLEEQGIITPVSYPTEWCAPIVVAPKKGTDDIRMCVDLSHLNRYVKRERYQSPSPAQTVADIAAENAQIFTKIDAKKGYHQCPLDKESQDLTTFITPFGRFKFLRAPYGISSISEHYNCRMDEAFAGLRGFRRVVDDIVIYDQNRAEHGPHIRQFLQRCTEKNITLNLSKWIFAQPTVEFAGFILTPNGYKIDPSITWAIAEFPTPANRTDLRSFIGLVNQLSASTPIIATLLAPLRPLLSTKHEYTWNEEFEAAFANIKKSLISAPILSYFDPARETRLSTDASRQGLGFILQQKIGSTWSLIQAGSRFLSDPESRYAIIELELLAVAWAITKCNIFLAGLPHFTVVTDHHPLIPLLNNHRLDEILNPQLQHLKTKIMGYSFTASWLKGTLNKAPDALSRNPTTDPQPDETLAESEIDDIAAMSTAEIRAVTGKGESLRLTKLCQVANNDPEYQKLKSYIISGFPQHRQQLPTECRRYWNVHTQLSLEDDIILYGYRLLIPAQMRREVLEQLHDSHQGMVRTKDRARLTVY